MGIWDCNNFGHVRWSDADQFPCVFGSVFVGCCLGPMAFLPSTASSYFKRQLVGVGPCKSALDDQCEHQVDDADNPPVARFIFPNLRSDARPLQADYWKAMQEQQTKKSMEPFVTEAVIQPPKPAVDIAALKPQAQAQQAQAQAQAAKDRKAKDDSDNEKNMEPVAKATTASIQQMGFGLESRLVLQYV